MLRKYHRANNAVRRMFRLVFPAIAFALASHPAAAQSVAADSVSATASPAQWGSGSCGAPLTSVSDGSIANPGVCYLEPLDPSFEITLTFSPSPGQFMTGLNVWANDGSVMTDNELRQMDIEVDYFDPTSGSVETLSLNDVDIGNQTVFATALFVPFPTGGAPGLFQVSEVRLSELVGVRPALSNSQVSFREVQGVYTTVAVAPEINVSSSESGTLSDGGTDAHGTEATGAANTVTYTITNTGTDTLTLGGTPSVSGETNISGPVTVGAPGSLSLAPGASTTFDVTYTPAAAGAFGFDIDVPSNDADESTFDIAVTGNANDAPRVTLSTGTNPPGGPFAITATFTEPVNDMTLADFDVTNGVASGFTNPSPGVYNIIVTPTDPDLPVNVVVPAAAATDSDGEPNSVSNTLTFIVVSAATPTDLDAIEEIILEETERDLRNSIALNQRAVREARARHAQYLRCNGAGAFDDLENAQDELEDRAGCPATRGLSVEPTFDGKLDATAKSISGSGSFFTQKSSIDGTSRRLAYGDLSFNRYDDGDTNASLNGRVAWERLVSEDVLRGLFVGATATKSDIDDDFTGSRTGFGLNAGVYFVDQLDEDLYWDGFVSVGVGQNDLDLGNGTIDVDGEYNTTSLQFGLAVTGEREYERFDLYPELSLAYGIANVGDAEINSSTGGGSATDTISVSNVSLATIRFRPEFVFEGEADRFGIVRNSFSAAPSIFCESVRTTSTESDCGGGLELEWSTRSEDGLGEFSARVSREVIGGGPRDQLSISYERQF